jgi:hypothetical protein
MKYLQLTPYEYIPVPEGSQMDITLRDIPESQRPILFSETRKEVKRFLANQAKTVAQKVAK